LTDWWESWRALWPQACVKGVDSLFALISWELWKERNACCFRRAATQLNAVKDQIKQQAELWVMAGNKHLGSLVQRVVG
jgi:hypothetical protein